MRVEEILAEIGEHARCEQLQQCTQVLFYEPQLFAGVPQPECTVDTSDENVPMCSLKWSWSDQGRDGKHTFNEVILYVYHSSIIQPCVELWCVKSPDKDDFSFADDYEYTFIVRTPQHAIRVAQVLLRELAGAH